MRAVNSDVCFFSFFCSPGFSFKTEKKSGRGGGEVGGERESSERLRRNEKKKGGGWLAAPRGTNLNKEKKTKIKKNKSEQS